MSDEQIKRLQHAISGMITGIQPQQGKTVKSSPPCPNTQQNIPTGIADALAMHSEQADAIRQLSNACGCLKSQLDQLFYKRRSIVKLGWSCTHGIRIAGCGHVA